LDVLQVFEAFNAVFGMLYAAPKLAPTKPNNPALNALLPTLSVRRMGRGGSRNPSQPGQTTIHAKTECLSNPPININGIVPPFLMGFVSLYPSYGLPAVLGTRLSIVGSGKAFIPSIGVVVKETYMNLNNAARTAIRRTAFQLVRLTALVVV
jgi:hypothetical protein